MDRQAHAHHRVAACRERRRAALERPDSQIHRTGGLLARVDRYGHVEHAGRADTLAQDDRGRRGRERASAVGNRSDQSARRGGCRRGDQCQRSGDSECGSPQSHTLRIGPKLERCNEYCVAWTRVRAADGRVRGRPERLPGSAGGWTDGPSGTPDRRSGGVFTPGEVRFQPVSTPSLALVWSWANLHEFVTEAP